MMDRELLAVRCLISHNRITPMHIAGTRWDKYYAVIFERILRVVQFEDTKFIILGAIFKCNLAIIISMARRASSGIPTRTSTLKIDQQFVDRSRTNPKSIRSLKCAICVAAWLYLYPISNWFRPDQGTASN